MKPEQLLAERNALKGMAVRGGAGAVVAAKGAAGSAHVQQQQQQRWHGLSVLRVWLTRFSASSCVNEH
jgi:hypothetical protein